MKKLRTVAPALIALGLLLIVGIVVFFAGGESSPSAKKAMPQRVTRQQAMVKVPASCVDRTLRYGISNDKASGDRAEEEVLFGAHPFPNPGFYAPNSGPASSVQLHVLFHGWSVLMYRPDLPPAKRKLLETWSKSQPQTVVIASTAESPYQIGAVRWGQQVGCGQLTDSGLQQVLKFAQSGTR